MTQTSFRKKLKASSVALTLALATLPATVNAAGLGKITVLSVLGQPLHAEIDISATRDEAPSLAARIASNDAFRQAGIEYVGALSDIRVSVDKRADGRPYLLLKSNRAINEPFLDVLLEMTWAAGRLQREYTFLLDPPESLQKSATPAAAIAPPVVVMPAASTPTHATPSAPAAEKKPARGMKVVRGNDGVQRITQAPQATATEPTEQPAAEGTPARADTGTTHQVKRGETLGKIAEQTLPEGVNLDQMLVALFRSNKEAFAGGNINRLKTGRILSIPDQAAIAAIDTKEARRIIIAQSADFNAYRKKLAAATEAAAPAKEEAPQHVATGKIEPKVQETTPAPATSKDKLEISKSTGARSTTDKNLAARAAAAEEDKLASDKSLKDANSRIADLDKNLADMRKMLELKSQGMADAQKQAQATKPAPATPPAPLPPAAVATTPPAPSAATQPQASPAAEKIADKPAETTEATKPADPVKEPVAAEQPPAEAKPAAEPKPAPKKIIAPPPPIAEPNFIDDSPELVYGGGGILALLLGYLGFKQWRKRKEASAEPAIDHDIDLSIPGPHAEPSLNSVFGHTGGQAVDTGSAAVISSLDTDFSVAGVGGTDTNEGVDPIAEADVYMAYGRNAQAEEILLDALKNEPTRHAIHLKLLDIYAARKSLKQFETIARDLHDQTNASGDEWEQAATLGLSIDPDNALYNGNAPTAAGAFANQAAQEYDPAATMVLTPQDFDKVTANLNPAADLNAADTPESLDFELDLGGDSVQNDAPASEDLDLGLDLGLGSDAPTPAMATELATDIPATPASSTDDNIIDFEIDVPSPAPIDSALSLAQPASAAPADELRLPGSPASSDSNPSEEVADLEFDLGEASANTPDLLLPEAAANAMPLAAAGIDLSSISLELEAPDAESPAKAQIKAENMAAPALSLDSPLPEIATPTPAASAAPAELADDGSPGSPEVDTKLELAMAYEEMGDKDGARELLQEVLNEGNARQKAAARSKLDQIG
ncbi:MAG: pilus assembly protein [Sterolibacterium sp.]|nr:pilus assembly protein [Sterolibacterium sp.]